MTSTPHILDAAASAHAPEAPRGPATPAAGRPLTPPSSGGAGMRSPSRRAAEPAWPTTPAHRVEVPASEQRSRAQQDPARPHWHVTPPWGWLNDPNGLLVWPGPDGVPLFHLFYQHNSHAPVHDLIEWGHQYSPDLVHWRDLPVALEPGPSGPDARGCWSGVIVADSSVSSGAAPVPTMVYSGASDRPTQTCCVATADPEDPLLRTWAKDVANPVIDAAPLSTGLDLPEMRDHSVWREDGRWFQVMGAGLPGAGADGAQAGAALCFSSPDLRRWSYEGPLAVGDGDVASTGSVWECPELLRLPGPTGSVDVLCVCAWHEGMTMRSTWMTGRRSGTRMTIEHVGRSDLGENYFYAPQSLPAPDGRRITIGWMQPNDSEAQRLDAGWAGSMSAPREMTVADDGTLRFWPIAELARLRGRALLADALDAEAESAEAVHARGRALEPVPVRLRGRSLDIEIDGRVRAGDDAGAAAGDPAESAALTVDLLASEDGARRTRVTLRRRRPTGTAGQEAWTGWLAVDRSASAAAGGPWEGAECRLLEGPVPLGLDGEVSVRILLDRSSLEVFVNGQPLSARVGSDPRDDRAVIGAGGLSDARARAWEMGPAYRDGRLEP